MNGMIRGAGAIVFIFLFVSSNILLYCANRHVKLMPGLNLTNRYQQIKKGSNIVVVRAVGNENRYSTTSIIERCISSIVERCIYCGKAKILSSDFCLCCPES